MAESEHKATFAGLKSDSTSDETPKEKRIHLPTVTRLQLRNHRVKTLKDLVKKLDIPCVFPCEKVDLVRAIWKYKCNIEGKEFEGADPLPFEKRKFEEPADNPEWETYHQLRKIPIEVKGNCPSQILPYLFLGGFDAARPNVLEEHNITAVVNLCAGKTETIEKDGRTFMKINAADDPEFDMSKHFESTYDFINENISKKQNVLVHCMAGVSRSATIVIVYLVRKYGLTVAQADQFISHRRPFINPNSGFLSQLDTFEEANLEKQ